MTTHATPAGAPDGPIPDTALRPLAGTPMGGMPLPPLKLPTADERAANQTEPSYLGPPATDMSIEAETFTVLGSTNLDRLPGPGESEPILIPVLTIDVIQAANSSAARESIEARRGHDPNWVWHATLEGPVPDPITADMFGCEYTDHRTEG